MSVSLQRIGSSEEEADHPSGGVSVMHSLTNKGGNLSDMEYVKDMRRRDSESAGNAPGEPGEEAEG